MRRWRYPLGPTSAERRLRPSRAIPVFALAFGVLGTADTSFAQLSSTPMLKAAPENRERLWSTGAFEALSAKDQKVAHALFEAQETTLPAGLRRLTLDQIAARKIAGQSWSEVFRLMKVQGLVPQQTLGQVLKTYNRRPRPSSATH